MWDPASYLRFGEQRSRPFFDLIAQVRAQRPRTVVDLGCGPGTLTAAMAARWPDARVLGIDSSPEMIARAEAAGFAATFTVADVADWRPEPDVDVVVSNAVLQWVPDHLDLLSRWVTELPAQAWLAVQVPGNVDAPSHRAMRAVAAQPRWRDRLVAATAARTMPDAVGYARLLTEAGCQVDAWETTYVHLLPVDSSGDHPVLRWLDGTGLRPVRAALADELEWAAFRAHLGERLATAYPVSAEGMVFFPFRRIFVVAQVPGKARRTR